MAVDSSMTIEEFRHRLDLVGLDMATARDHLVNSGAAMPRDLANAVGVLPKSPERAFSHGIFSFITNS
jgi:hypothetical protein